MSVHIEYRLIRMHNRMSMVARIVQRLRRFFEVATYPSYGSCGGGDPAAVQREIERRRAERKAEECRRLDRGSESSPR
jgi:hypothetical protein